MNMIIKNLVKEKNFMKNKQTVLISGNRGYIGSRLQKKLEDEGYDVVGIDHRDGDDILTADLPDVSIVYHLAAQAGAMPSIKNPMWDARNNILGTIRIAKRYAGKAKIIYTTSGGAKDPQSPYGLSKKTGEEYLKIIMGQSCNEPIICRLSSIYGDKPRGVVDNFIREKKPVIFGDGSAERDFVHVDDIVEALRLASSWIPGEYELGSGKGTTINEIALETGKTFVMENPRIGEIHTAILQNTTPDWAPKIDVIEYIKEKCGK